MENRAFLKFKKDFSSSPILTYPDYDKVQLAHRCIRSRNLVSFNSRNKWKGNARTPEQNYSVTEKEALIFVNSVKHFDYYLFGHKFTAIVDHSALRYLFKFKAANPCIARWALLFPEFEFNIKFKFGKEHIVPDSLSRSVNVVIKETSPPGISQLLTSENIRKEKIKDELW